MIEKKTLQRMYLKEYKTLDEIANYFNMSQIEDLQYIKANYNIESPGLIAHKLNRSLNSIHDAAFRLGVTKPRGGRRHYKYDL